MSEDFLETNGQERWREFFGKRPKTRQHPLNETGHLLLRSKIYGALGTSPSYVNGMGEVADPGDEEAEEEGS